MFQQVNAALAIATAITSVPQSSRGSPSAVGWLCFCIGELFRAVRPVSVGLNVYQGVPNRDSLTYERLYGFHPEAMQTTLRGTLRFPGFWASVEQFVKSGMLTNEPSKGPLYVANLPAPVQAILTSVGIAKDTIMEGPTQVDQVAKLLWDALQFREGEQDMVVLQHRFRATRGQESLTRTAELILLGDKAPNGLSAMARTVGAPAALAASYLLQGDGKTKAQGVMRPLHPALARQFLRDLRDHAGIEAREYTHAN
jgi:alpha-aminoadipic semialdehyde synthase